MIKYNPRHLITGLMATTVFTIASFSFPFTACADVREEARTVMMQLRQNALGEKQTEEMKSADDAFRMAEELYHQNERSRSEQYYRLAIQKARIIATGPRPLTPPIHNRTTSATMPLPTQRQEQPLQTEETPEPDYFSDNVSSDKLVGAADVYIAKKGESLRVIASKLGVSRQHLAAMNKLDPKAPLKAGQTLKYNNRKIVPARVKEGIVINIPDRTLYFFKEGRLVKSIPVALGVAVKNKKYDWMTPTGKFRIVAKQKDPTWYVPPSIQAEMEEAGKEVITSVPPGPGNPLGKYAMKTSLPGILIHSTTKPWSIYSFASHGCIRVYPEHMQEFFKEVRVNTPGEIIYKPVKLALTEDGRIYMEVHQDIYGRAGKLETLARNLIENSNLSDRVDWKKVEAIIKQKKGIAEDVTL